MAQVGRYSLANRISTSCSILLLVSDYNGGQGEFSQDQESRLNVGCLGRLPSQPLYTRLGLGESVLGYRDDFLAVALPCTPSLDFHIGRGLLRQCFEWASRGTIDAPCGPSVFIHTRYPHTQEWWGHPLVSSPRVPGGLEESRRDSNPSSRRHCMRGTTAC